MSLVGQGYTNAVVCALGYSLKSYKFLFISENFRSFKSAIFIFWSTVGSRNHAKQNCKGRTVCGVNILK